MSTSKQAIVLIRCIAILVVAVLGLAIADNTRPWKRLQVEFFELERQQLSSHLEAAQDATGESIAALEARIETQEEHLEGRSDEIKGLLDDLNRFGGKHRAAEMRRNRLEFQLESMSRQHIAADAETSSAETTSAKPAVAELIEELRQTRMETESLAELIADREQKLDAVRSDLDDAKQALARERAPIDDLERRLAALPAPPALPLGGLLTLGVSVREVVLPAADAVDRCVTCHLGAVRDDLESDDWPAPFRGHPRPELFLTADSPHPYGRFGCTTCHGGDGRATDFSRAGHQPATLEQADRRYPMLPLDLTEAACGRCHGGEVFMPRAETLDLGRQLIQALGCTACHASDHPALRALPKVGPSLIGIAGKTTPAWAYKWLQAPSTFRAATRMPHSFESGEPRQRPVEIRAIVDYLWQVSRPATHGPPPDGEIEAGRALFDTIGCTGCHLLGLETNLDTSLEQRHGPHLAGTGSKVSDRWLYAWLRDPRAYRHDTPMPSLRLDEREAADLTAYLMTRRDPAWEGLSLPATDIEIRDRLVLAALAREHTLENSQARLSRMSERDKNVYLGQQTITRYGCHGCHEITGFEQSSSLGPSLSKVGLLYRAKLAMPERGSEARNRWPAAAHQPVYSLSDTEAHALTVALLGLSDEQAADRHAPVGATPTGTQALDLARGRRILARYNCRGCHRIEGHGGGAFTGREAKPPLTMLPSGLPPDLIHVGARLQAPWLYDYLADPGRRKTRPWLKIRMPTFGLSEVESNALVRYFAARDARPLFAAEPTSPRPKIGLAVGRVVFGMLQCGDCHRPESEESSMPQLAPDYAQASSRLRPEWVTSWILDPESWLPGTAMPANFLPDDAEEPGSSYLIGSINTPIFAVERDRLLRLLGSEEELQVYLSDPQRVAAALRDYLWTLGN